MKREYLIGNGPFVDLNIQSLTDKDGRARIFYDKGDWKIEIGNITTNIKVNGKQVGQTLVLDKYDIIQIEQDTIYWADYLYEGENQDLEKRDFFSYHGRLSRANYRALFLLAIGLTICIFFFPTFIIGAKDYFIRKIDKSGDILRMEEIRNIQLPVYAICYGLLTLWMTMNSIKRMRDIKEPFWKLLIPIQNLKLLFFEESKP